MTRVFSKLRQRLLERLFLFVILPLFFLLLFPSLNEANEKEKEERGLSVKDCIDLALKRNLDIVIERINPQIQEMEIFKEKAVFDPSFMLEVKNSKSSTEASSSISGAGGENIFSELLSLEWEDRLEQEGLDFKSRIAKKIITGGKVELAFTTSEFKSNSFFQYNDKTYTSSLTLSLMQPLLRDFGITLNRTRLNIASNKHDMSADELKMKITTVVSEIQVTYWDLVSAIEEMSLRLQSLELAQNLLNRNRALVNAGRLPTVAILHAETGVASRKEGVLLAKNAARNAQDHLKRMIDLLDEPSHKEKTIFPSDKPVYVERKIKFADSYAIAQRNRPDLNQAKTALANQKLAFNLAKNQLLPKLDFLASYNLNNSNSHGDKIDDLLEGDTYSWEAGMALEIPLGTRLAKSQYTQEKMRLRMAEFELNNLKKEILLDVKEAVRQFKTSLERVKVTRSAGILAKKKLKAEEEKFKLGRSTTTNLLEFQEEMTIARTNENRALVDYQKSLIHWEAVTGQTIQNNNIEVLSR